MLESLLQMHESAGRLDQPFEEIIVRRIFVQPNLFEDVVRLVVALLIPASEVGAIVGMIDNLGPVWNKIVSFELTHEARNPLAFVHEGSNLLPARMMGKLARFSFADGEARGRSHRRRLQ